MAKKVSQVPITFGGYDDTAYVGSLGDGAGTMSDVEFDGKFGIKTVAGFSTYYATPMLASSFDNGELYGFHKQSGQDFIIAQAPDRMLYLSAGMTGWGSINSAITANILRNYVFATLNDTVFYANTQDLMGQWSGALSGSVSLSARCLEVKNDRLFAVEKDSSLLRWSTIGDGTSFPAANYAYIGRDDSDWIRAIKVYGDSLFVFKSDSCYKVSGNDFDPTTGNYSIEHYPQVEGCISNRGICLADNMLFYYSKYGMMVFNGVTSQLVNPKTTTRTTIGEIRDYWKLFNNESAGRVELITGGYFVSGIVEYYDYINKVRGGNIHYRSQSPTVNVNGIRSAAVVSDITFTGLPNVNSPKILYLHGGAAGSGGPGYLVYETGITNNGSARTATYYTDFLKPYPDKFQVLRLKMLVKRDSNFALTVNTQYDYASNNLESESWSGTGDALITMELPRKYIDSVKFLFSGASFHILKAWFEIEITDVAERYSGNQRIE